ncbi:MAG TPA: GGDEF domain-containing protein [Thermoanaerobaculia bacterium]|nr:GGDEF domain-containing protein [Thermoanaerobaculia bacterium]
MSQVPQGRQLAAITLPVALALAAVGAGAQSALLAPEGLLGHGAAAGGLVLLVAAASLHRPLGGSGLGLGTLPLVLAFGWIGVPAAAAAAGLGSSLGQALERRWSKNAPEPPPERRSTARIAESAAQLALAVFAGGSVFRLLAPDGGGDDALALAAGGGGLAYLAVAALMPWVSLRVRAISRRGVAEALLVPLSLDLLGWAVGAILAAVAATSGLALASALVIAFALLAFEAYRNARQTASSRRWATDLEAVTRASARIRGASGELAGLVVDIATECERVVPYSFLELRLEGLSPHKAPQVWSTGPERLLTPRPAAPDPFPPALPGFHRRKDWRVLDFALSSDRPLGHLRLWCDPRRLEPSQAELLSALAPQLAATLDRARLDREARLDPLTGLAARRFLDSRLAESYQRAVDGGAAMAVALCDLDHFKSINDTWGHGVGDQALAETARVLLAEAGARSLAGRWGGEEFLLLLDECSSSEALAAAERIRHAVEHLQLEAEGEPLRLTISIGVVGFPEVFAGGPEELVDLADRALYEAKRRGRNLTLLHLGRGRFRTAHGEVLVDPDAPAAPEPPRLFA